MQGTIRIDCLEIVCIVGILPHERQLPQKIILDVELDVNLGAICTSRNLNDSVDYAEVAQFLTDQIVMSQYELLETLTMESCSNLLKKWPRITCCKITVKKPSAIPNAKYASVSIKKHQHSS
ncbi:MAG: dihydroneopterin aldolase [Proteobacteria bacterium]|nr:dihydroneopterin aldolase [Pseudomonadota bacterium]